METALTVFRWIMIAALVTVASTAPGTRLRARLGSPRIPLIVNAVMLAAAVLALAWLVGNKALFMDDLGALTGEYSRCMIFGTLAALCGGLGVYFARKDPQEKKNG